MEMSELATRQPTAGKTVIIQEKRDQQTLSLMQMSRRVTSTLKVRMTYVDHGNTSTGAFATLFAG
jgi:hypothetical protein